MIALNQSRFDGGMNLLNHSAKLGPNEYVMLINGRCRDQRVEPIEAPVEDTNLPTGKKQGLFAFDDYLLLFVAGQAFWRSRTSTSWTIISGFQMSQTAERFYVALITGSSANFRRKRTPDVGGAASKTISYISTAGPSGTVLATANGLPAGLLVQDGISQPWIIFSNLNCRVTQTYAQWVSGSAQEYVPIGTQMVSAGTKLFILGLDGYSLYQSVSGRMLDFVVNVASDGTAGGPADTTSNAVSASPVTGIRSLTLDSFLVSTKRSVWIVQLDRDNLVFGEPSYIHNELMSSAVTNERAAIEVNGDYQFIDFNGIRSFNAVQNLKFEGDNSPFSANIDKVLEGILQTSADTAAIAFNNYAIFSVNSVMGFILAVYDGIIEKWVSLDIHDASRVSNFAVTTGLSTQQLWVLTAAGRVFQLFTGTTMLTPMLYTRSFQDDDLRTEYKAKEVQAQIEEGGEGLMQIIPYCDGKRFSSKSRTLRETAGLMLWPLEWPLDFASEDQVDVISVPFTNLPNCRATQLIVTWTGGGNLNGLQINTDAQVGSVTQEKQASYANSSNT